MLFVYRALFHMHPERRHKCLFLDIVRPITHASYMNHESYRGQQFFFQHSNPHLTSQKPYICTKTRFVESGWGRKQKSKKIFKY